MKYLRDTRLTINNIFLNAAIDYNVFTNIIRINFFEKRHLQGTRLNFVIYVNNYLNIHFFGVYENSFFHTVDSLARDKVLLHLTGLKTQTTL